MIEIRTLLQVHLAMAPTVQDSNQTNNLVESLSKFLLILLLLLILPQMDKPAILRINNQL